MLELIAQVQPYVEIISQALVGIIILATVLARAISGGKYSEDITKAGGQLIKLLAWLPTLGLNPNTKKLQEAYDDLKKDNQSLTEKLGEVKQKK